MADETYMPVNYSQQGGVRRVIGSGGSYDIESGGEIDVEAGAALKLAGVALTATAAEINQAADESANVETVAATNVIAASESGKTFFLAAATEFVSTLPVLAAGLRFTFIVSAAPSGADYTIISNAAANNILGHVLSSDLDAAGDGDSETSGADTISFVSAKAVVGDRVDVICDGTNWFARCSCKAFDAITITTAA